MDGDSLYKFLYIGIPLLVGITGYIMRLESKINSKVDDEKVRQLLSDKITPVKECVDEMKIKIDNIYYKLIQDNDK